MKNTELWEVRIVRMKSDWRRIGLAIVVVGASLGTLQPAWGQAKQKGPKLVSKPVSLTTKDGVVLSCVYFPAAKPADDRPGAKGLADDNKGKSTPVMMLVHDWDGRGNEFYPLARFFQQRRISVIVPDLRGHGESVRRIVGGVEKKIDRKRMRRSDIQSALLDLEAVKKFLLEENNKGKLNIEMLTVLGSGFGGTLALKWSAIDWNAPRLPTYKQGQDVKALVLLSPKLAYRGVSCRAELKHAALRSQVAVCIIVGKDAPNEDDANRIHRALYRPKVDEETGRVEIVSLDTNLEGTRILSSPLGMRTATAIDKFLTRQIRRRASQFAWQDRKPPFEQ